ncbi:MAG: hypothetical protein ACYCTL_13695 [Acidimicrobiales bacterium]
MGLTEMSRHQVDMVAIMDCLGGDLADRLSDEDGEISLDTAGKLRKLGSGVFSSVPTNRESR